MRIAHRRSAEPVTHTDSAGNVIAKVGRESYFTEEAISLEWYGASFLEVGNFCSIAEGVRFIVNGEHAADAATTYPLPGVKAGTKGPIRIGHDVWVGNGATILSGVTIGNGAIIGAGSVVTKDVPPYAIVAGNPARLKRLRFQPHEIEQLLASRWWEWTDAEINDAREALCEPMPAFLEYLNRSTS